MECQELPFTLMTTFPIDFLLACLLISFGYYCCLLTYGVFAVLTGFLFSISYAWFLEKWLAWDAKRQQKELDIAPNR